MVRERYSASMEERETVGCFLEDKEIGLESRKAMNPKMEHWSEVSLAQSKSQKVWRENETLRKYIPRVGVPHKYKRMCLTTKKWRTNGFYAWISWHDLQRKWYWSE